jgi:putative flippase GtrA
MNYLIVGYIVAPLALLFNFVSHKFWSFRDVGSARGKTTVQAMRYLVLIALSAVMNMLLMYIFYGLLELPLLWARVVCTGIGILWTFPLQRFWVYKPSPKFL